MESRLLNYRTVSILLSPLSADARTYWLTGQVQVPATGDATASWSSTSTRPYQPTSGSEGMSAATTAVQTPAVEILVSSTAVASHSTGDIWQSPESEC